MAFRSEQIRLELIAPQADIGELMIVQCREFPQGPALRVGDEQAMHGPGDPMQDRTQGRAMRGVGCNVDFLS